MSIKAVNLCHVYGQGTALEQYALKNVNLEIGDGQFIGLIGHTGSGKSTLIQHFNGLLKATSGELYYNGENIYTPGYDMKKLRSKVGLVFQYPEHQLFAATVREDVAFGPRNLGLSTEEVERRVRAALEDVHLDPEEVGGKSPFELSGGQQRRVAFAGVLAMEPRVLVLDEPVAGLDPVAREEFLSLIAELHGAGRAVVMVSHSMDDLARLADRVLVLNEGRLFFLGTPAEVFARGEELRAIGLDVPAAQKLAAELRKEGFDLPRDLYGLESLADDLARALTGGEPSREPKADAAPGRDARETPRPSGEAPHA